MDLYEEFFTVVKKFNKARIKYAIVGGIAVSFYDIPRYTKDIDILTRAEEFVKIEAILQSLGYEVSAQPMKFINTRITLYRFAKIENNLVLMLDILIGEELSHEKIIKNAIRLKSAQGMVKVATIKDLIKLKSIRNSDIDKIDIKKLKDL